MPRLPRARRTSTPPPRPRPWTRTDLARLPDDGNRYEVLDGALLVTPLARFSHQVVVSRLSHLLGAYCAMHRVGVVVGPGAISHGKSELQPDVQLIVGAVRLSSEWTDLPLPALVVEVLSDSTRRRDLGIKREAYLSWGIAEYWVVDIDARAVTVFSAELPDGAIVTETLRWTPREKLPAFTVELVELFAE